MSKPSHPLLCVRCSKELEGKRRKYCSDHCAYWFKQANNDKPKKFSVSQHMKMQRAGRAQFSGKIGCRFN